MKKTIRIAASALAAATLLSSMSGAFACTGTYVGKNASADGTTIIARSEDISPSDYDKIHTVVPAGDEAGRTLTDINGFSYPLPTHTYKYTTMSDYASAGDGVYPAVCTNDQGVSVTGTVSASGCDAWKTADPTVKTGLREAVLPALVAATASSAKQGVENLLAAVDAYGSAEGNVILIADQAGAWIVEIYGGHQYAAMKLADDQVAVFGNQFMLGAVDPKDAENVIVSEGLYTTLETAGLTVKDDAGAVLLAQSVCGKTRSDGSNMRTWVGHERLAPASAGTYETNTFYPLLYTPDEKVSLADVMAIYRDRYQDTALDVTVAGQEGNRAIAVSTTPETHIVQIYSDLPAACSAVTWVALGGGEHSVFLPEFSGVTETAPAYSMDAPTYTEGSAYWAFKRVCGLADVDRGLYSAGVQNFWKLQEGSLIEQMSKEVETVKGLYAADAGQAAAYVNALASDVLADQMSKSDVLYAGLLTTLTHNEGLSASKTPITFAPDLPLRQAAEAKGYTVSWDAAAGAVVLTKDGKSTSVALDGVDAYAVNGVTYAAQSVVDAL